MLNRDNEDICLRKKYNIVVPLFGAVYTAPNKGTTILYWFRSPMDHPTENRKIQGLFKAIERFFSILFKADLIFKGF